MNEAYLFNRGENYQSYKFLGSFRDEDENGVSGFRFAVWAPHASKVAVVGDFNAWDPNITPLQKNGDTGIWQGFVPGAKKYDCYKYAITDNYGHTRLKADPFARHAETRPGTASRLYYDTYQFHDANFKNSLPDARSNMPLNIYELHLGSFKRYPDGSVFSYRDIAPKIASYVKDQGYNAIELLPLSEYPYDGSWGYQVTGYFAVTSRYGTPLDFKFFVDTLHAAGIRVIMDFVPAHFPKDDFALAKFDGEPLYEYPDKTGEHPEWGTLIFNYRLAEVQSFLMSAAYFWLDEFHMDGLRFDAVSSMLYRNYGRNDVLPNADGSFKRDEASSLLQKLNLLLRRDFPKALLIAEESTAYPRVTHEVKDGGLGFTHKWNMGFMHDTLDYMQTDYYARGNMHDRITFSMTYAFSERFVLPFSHDEVVHGKKSMLDKMPGDPWRKFASLRCCYMYQISHPGAKLNFMGSEFAPYIEWRYDEELEWFMLSYEPHRAMQKFCSDLNKLYLQKPQFWQRDDKWEGFKWVMVDNSKDSVFAYERLADHEKPYLVILNMTPKSYPEYKLYFPTKAKYRIALNSDDAQYGGSGYGAELMRTGKVLRTRKVRNKDYYVLKFTLPPLCGLFLAEE